MWYLAGSIIVYLSLRGRLDAYTELTTCPVKSESVPKDAGAAAAAGGTSNWEAAGKLFGKTGTAGATEPPTTPLRITIPYGPKSQATYDPRVK